MLGHHQQTIVTFVAYSPPLPTHHPRPHSPSFSLLPGSRGCVRATAPPACTDAYPCATRTRDVARAAASLLTLQVRSTHEQAGGAKAAASPRPSPPSTTARLAYGMRNSTCALHGNGYSVRSLLMGMHPSGRRQRRCVRLVSRRLTARWSRVHIACGCARCVAGSRSRDAG